MKSVDKIKSFFFTKGITRADIIITVILAFSVLLIRFLGFSVYSSFNSRLDISYGYMAKQTEDGSLYVLDNEHERIIGFNEDSNIFCIISNPGDDKSDWLYIDGFDVDGDYIYINASEWDGMALSREAVLKYNLKGKLLETITDRDYSEERTNKHRFYGLSANNGDVRFIECLQDYIICDGLEIAYPNAFNAVSDAAFYEDNFYILDKTGIITEYNADLSGSVIYSAEKESNKNIVPYRMSVNSKGEIFFTDIRNSAVCKVNRETGTADNVYDTDSLTVYENSEQNLILVDAEGVLVTDGNSKVNYFTLNKTVLQRIVDILGIITGIIIIVLSLTLAIRIIYNLVKRKNTVTKVLSFWFIVTIITVTAILCGMLLKSFSENYRSKLEEQLRSAAYMIANQISNYESDAIEEVEKTGEFGKENYNRLISVMDTSFNMDIDFYNNVYCNILKLDKKAGEGYAVAYLDQSIGNYYPLDEVETKELIDVYENKSEVWNQNLADISGSYLAVKVPVLDQNGEVIAAVAVGAETYIIDELITELQIKVLMSIIIIILIIWVAIGEGISFVGNLSTYRQDVRQAGKHLFPGHFIRLLVFFVFAVYNMTATFLPVYIMKRTDLFPEGIRDFMGALPVTVNLFIIGLMSLFCATLIRKYGMKKIVAASVISSMVGNLLMFIFPNYITIIIGLVLDGIGVGLITNSLYVLITYIKDEVSRIWGLSAYNGAYLSGINFGMMLGSLLAVLIGQRFVFLVVGLVWLALLIISLYMVREMSYFIEIQGDDKKETETSTKEFVLKKPVISFITLIQNPYIVFGSFAFYYIPLYCDSNGYSETICSLLIMLYSEVAVICGDVLTKRMSMAMGDKAMYTAVFGNVVALMVFVFSPNMLGVVIALMLMGIAASYGKPVQQKFYLGLKVTGDYGEDKAMGIYNFSENIGESLGPMVMGRLMATGPSIPWVAGFLAIITGMSSFHYILNKRELKNE
ncbi:MAG: MFS transporter [Butyrivibrio sp.]|nr:MFS transporter [Butyrivibrio sp.]